MPTLEQKTSRLQKLKEKLNERTFRSQRREESNSQLRKSRYKSKEAKKMETELDVNGEESMASFNHNQYIKRQVASLV
jgi:transposase